MRYTLWLVVGFMMSPVPTVADMIGQIEVRQTNTDYGQGLPKLDSAANEIDVSYYFSPVDTSRGPEGLAPFLTRADEFGFSYIDWEGARDISVRGTWNLSDTGWFVSGRYQDRGTLLSATWPFEDDEYSSRSYGLSVGNYILENTSVSVFLGSSSSERENTLTYDAPFPTPSSPLVRITETSRSDSDSTDYGLEIFHFGRIGTRGYSLNASYSRREIDSTSTYVDLSSLVTTTFTNDITETSKSFSATFHPIDRLGVNVFAGNVDAGTPSGLNHDVRGISIEWFPIPSLALELAYQESEMDILPWEFETSSLGLVFRF